MYVFLKIYVYIKGVFKETYGLKLSNLMLCCFLKRKTVVPKFNATLKSEIAPNKFVYGSTQGMHLRIYASIHSFWLFLQRLFKSNTTQRRSRHSTDTMSEFHAEAHRELQVKDLPKVP